jgi:hypothetical protein
MPKVLHYKDKVDTAVYIGRPSKWGNPYVIGADGTREDVVRKYEEYIQTQPELLAALPELKGRDLMCWCSPAACHGDVLLRLANKENTNEDAS